MRAVHANASWTRGLGLAAAPTFAVMAGVTQVFSGGAQMMCASPHGALPVDGMVLMYALMSVFHLGPWLKLISETSIWSDHHD